LHPEAPGRARCDWLNAYPWPRAGR
jgi:hypothetical protein